MTSIYIYIYIYYLKVVEMRYSMLGDVVEGC